MTKIARMLLVIFFVILAYLMLMMFRGFIGDAVETANSSANWSNFPGGQEAIVGFPFWVYFVPAGVGIAALVAVLKEKL